VTQRTSAPTVLAGRYRLGDVIGRGGMGDVHAAVDLRLDRQVAVKILRPEMAAQPEIRTRFESEALSAARLSHPNVVTVYDTGEDDGVPFIVMECLPGRTLGGAMATGPADQEWLRHVTADVLGALGAAHAAGVVHRDVKPGNILLTDDGRAKVADFGIAKSLEPVPGRMVDTTAAHLMLGTPAYLAPERIEGEPASPRSDIYSVGVVLYEALAGAKPFTGDTPLAVAMAAVHDDPEPLGQRRPDVEPALAAVVARAMQRDPAARFASAAEMEQALGAAPPAPPHTPLADSATPTLVDAPVDDRTRVLAGVAPSRPPVVVALPALWRRRRLAVLAVTTVFLVAVLAVALASGHDRNNVKTPSTADTVPVSVTTTPVVSAPPTTPPGVQIQISVPARRGKRHGGGKG
jgi:serine/threonine-protein kinase